MSIKWVAACEMCNMLIPHKKNSQRYCAECSEKRDLERKKLWARANPQDPDYITKKRRKSIARILQAGQERSLSAAQGIDWAAEEPPPIVWLVRFGVPFTYAVSKNHIYTTTSSGHVFLRKENLAFRKNIEEKARQATATVGVVQAKLYIDILVQKPNHRGDAVNVVDTVCDALKKGVGVDDRWFCIRRLDWQIVKTDPMLYIGLSQSEREHHQVCSSCGHILPYAEFQKKNSSKNGHGRTCKACRTVKS